MNRIDGKKRKKNEEKSKIGEKEKKNKIKRMETA